MLTDQTPRQASLAFVPGTSADSRRVPCSVRARWRSTTALLVGLALAIAAVVGIATRQSRTGDRNSPSHRGTLVLNSDGTRTGAFSHLVVPAVETLGWIAPARDADQYVGAIRAAGTSRLPETRVVDVRIRASASGTVITGQHGIVRFAVPPGRYRVRLANGRNCDAGADPATATVPRRGTAYVQVTCEQP